MKIEFLAHASFFITRANGSRILIDPYESNSFSGRVGYEPIEEEPDVIVITHDHKDHSHTESIAGNFSVIRYEAEREDGLSVRSVQAYHDQEQGTKFGGIIDMKILEFDGWRICHCGDLGETLDDPSKVEMLRNLDVLIIPVGGYYTLDAELAFTVTQKLKPKIVIPCHYKTLSCGFDIDDRELFLNKFAQDQVQVRNHWSVDIDNPPNHEQTICLAMDMKYDRAKEQVVGHYQPRPRS